MIFGSYELQATSISATSYELRVLLFSYELQVFLATSYEYFCYEYFCYECYYGYL